MKILLADDSVAMTNITTEMLEAAGHQVAAALDGKQALELFESFNPDLLILDVEMPELNGFEVAKQVRATEDEHWHPIIFLTSHDDEEYLKEGLELGGDDYISKSVSPVVLETKVNALYRMVTMQQKLMSLTVDLNSEIQDRKNIEQSLKRQAKQQQLVVKLGRLAITESAIEKIMHTIVLDIATILDVNVCKIFKLSSNEKYFLLKSGVGFDATLLDKFKSDNVDKSPLNLALETSETITFQNIDQDDRFANISSLLDHNIKSGVVVVINGVSRPWGTFTVLTTTERKFSTEDIEFIKVVSNILSETIIRKSVEEKLLESEERFTQLANNIDEMLWVASADASKALYVSPAYEKITGRKVEDFYADPEIWVKDIHQDDQALVGKSFMSMIENGTPFSNIIRICRPDGEIRTVNDAGFPVLDHHGKLSRIAGVARDITEQKKAEETLERMKRLYEYILQSAGEGIFGVNVDGEITFINAAAVNLVGSTVESLVGQPCYDLIHFAKTAGKPYDQSNSPIAIALSDGVSHKSLDEVLRGKDDIDFPVDYVCTPIIEGESEITGAVVVFRDISKRKVLETELQMAQKLESVGQLAAGIAHEINTPAQYTGDNIRFLNDGFGDLIKLLSGFMDLFSACQKGSVDEEQIAHMNEVIDEADLDYLLEEIPLALTQSQQGIESISHIVLAMKEFSHPGTEDKELVSVNHVVENTVTVTKNEWKYVSEIELDLDETLPLIPCYTQKIGQVVMNLIVNAAHAIGDVIDKEASELGKIHISTTMNGEMVEIRIKDSGTGIPQDIVDRIFDPFFTTKGVGKGTGQGLAIARSEIVDKHKGSLTCESVVGKGTTFVIRLPVTEVEEEVEAAL
jgi:PAS domain S-box-containing protein